MKINELYDLENLNASVESAEDDNLSLDFKEYDDGYFTPKNDIYEVALEQMYDVISGLEEIKYQLEESLANGGLDKQSEIFVNTAIKSACGKWIIPKQTINHSLESFDGDGAIVNTEYAMENVAYSLEGMWSRIAETTNAILTSVNSWNNKYNVSVGVLRNRTRIILAALDKGVKSHNDFKEDELKYHFTHISNLLIQDELAPVKGLKEITKIIKDYSTYELLEPIALTYAKELKAIDVSTTDLNLPSLKLDTIVKKCVHASKLELVDCTDRRENNNTHYWLSTKKVIVGNRALIIGFKSDSNGIIKNITTKFIYVDSREARYFVTQLAGYAVGTSIASSLGWGMFSYWGGLIGISSVSEIMKRPFPALNSSELKEVLQAILNTLAVLDEVEYNPRHRIAAIKNIADINKQISDKLDKATDNKSANKEAIKSLKNWVNATSGISLALMRADMEIRDQALTTARSAYMYALQNFNNLKRNK